jgi:hypothetical protein
MGAGQGGGFSCWQCHCSKVVTANATAPLTAATDPALDRERPRGGRGDDHGWNGAAPAGLIVADDGAPCLAGRMMPGR